MRTASLLAAVIFTGCVVGDPNPRSAGTPDGNSNPADGSGGSPDAAPPPTARLQVTATSSPNAGEFAPSNVVAIWVETQAGAIVRTIQRHSAVRTQHLVAWVAKAGINDADAVSGATRLNHLTPLTADWALTDRLGQTIPDGTYVLRMESADLNSTTADQNRQGTFTFIKGPAPQTQTGLTNGGFTNVSITFTPAP